MDGGRQRDSTVRDISAGGGEETDRFQGGLPRARLGVSDENAIRQKKTVQTER